MPKNSRIGTRHEQLNDQVNAQIDLLQEQAEAELLNKRVKPGPSPVKGPIGNLVIHNVKAKKKGKKDGEK